MIMHHLNKISVEINREYTEEQIFSAEQQVPTPHHTNILYFIAYFAFTNINNRTMKILRDVLKKLNNLSTIDSNIIAECKTAICKNSVLESKMKTLQFSVLMFETNDYREVNGINKPTLIYRQFFEMKNVSVEYLVEALDIERRTRETIDTNEMFEP